MHISSKVKQNACLTKKKKKKLPYWETQNVKFKKALINNNKNLNFINY